MTVSKAFGTGRMLLLALGVLISLSGIAALARAAGPGNDGTSPDTLDKPAVAAAYASLRAEGAMHPATKHPEGPVGLVPAASVEPGPMTPHAADSGFIVESPLGPPGMSNATFVNDWYEATPTRIIEVYAGALVRDPQQGIVTVAIWDASHATWLGGGTVRAPHRDGALRITGASSGRLDLVAADGSSASFDVTSQAFK